MNVMKKKGGKRERKEEIAVRRKGETRLERMGKRDGGGEETERITDRKRERRKRNRNKQ